MSWDSCVKHVPGQHIARRIGRGSNLPYVIKPPPVGRRAAGRSGRACGLSGPVPPGHPAAQPDVADRSGRLPAILASCRGRDDRALRCPYFGPGRSLPRTDSVGPCHRMAWLAGVSLRRPPSADRKTGGMRAPRFLGIVPPIGRLPTGGLSIAPRYLSTTRSWSRGPGGRRRVGRCGE